MVESHAMRTRVKICGITRVEDALAAAHAGADAIGMIFWSGTPRCVDIDRAKSIAAALPAFVTAVGLFVDPQEDEVRAVLDGVPLDMLQFHGDEEPRFCGSFAAPYIKAVTVGADRDLLQYASRYADARGLVFDAFVPGGMPGGMGTTFDWSTLTPELVGALGRPVILSGGLTPQNVGEAIRAVRPWAVDVSSGVEASGSDGKPRRGIKDAAKITSFVQGVRNADA